MRILIPDDYQRATERLSCMDLLKGHSVTVLGDLDREPAALHTLAETEALALIRERTRIDAAFLDKMPKLRCISQTGKIARHIDIAACTARGVAVMEGVGSPVAPAELTWALIMAARRHLVTAACDLKAGKWQTTIGETLRGQCLGIWGYGKIGRLIAGYGQAFGMKVCVWGSEESRHAASTDGHIAFAAKEALFEQADVVSLHLRLVPATQGIVRRADLDRMKETALFVNTSRAELVEPGTLEAALVAGRPGFAAIDVFESEPVYDPAHPLLRLPNALCTPHLGYVERNSYELYFSKAFENLVNFSTGRPTNVVNPEALPQTR